MARAPLPGAGSSAFAYAGAVARATHTPALNPWHLAQSLLANSPLQQEVLDMVESLPIDPFYKELVYGGQSGVSMHTLYQGEIAHFGKRKSTALHDLVALALQDSIAERLDSARWAAIGLKLHDAQAERVALHLAKGELDSAHVVVDSALAANPGDPWFEVQDLALALMAQEAELSDADGNAVSALQDIAGNEKAGAGEALAWLMMLGTEYDEEIMLPDRNKARRPRPERTRSSASHLLAAYPNPSNGPVYLVFRVPEGVAQAEMKVHDALGRLVMQQRIAPRHGIVELLPTDLSTGMHVAELLLDGVRVATTKVEVMR